MFGLVSIIMPNYNCANYIRETIESVINQTYTNWELLFVDDLSTDKSVEIAKIYNDDRIKIYINEKNCGAAYSRNKALREAKGKWIAFLDSDDIWHPDKLTKQITFMENNNYSFSNTYYSEIDEESKDLGRQVLSPMSINKRQMFNYCYIGCLTAIYKTEKIGLLQIDNSIKKRNDYALWLKVSKKAKCYCYPEILAKYRRRQNSLSSQSKWGLVRYHFVLFRVSEGMGFIKATYFTCKNIFYGVIKKLVYIKRNV